MGEGDDLRQQWWGKDGNVNKGRENQDELVGVGTKAGGVGYLKMGNSTFIQLDCGILKWNVRCCSFSWCLALEWQWRMLRTGGAVWEWEWELK